MERLKIGLLAALVVGVWWNGHSPVATAQAQQTAQVVCEAWYMNPVAVANKEKAVDFAREWVTPVAAWLTAHPGEVVYDQALPYPPTGIQVICVRPQ